MKKKIYNANSTQSKPLIEKEKKQGFYSSISIKGYRLFADIEFKDLGRINLFFGPNNSGKTTILEAIFTHACGLNCAAFFGQIPFKRTQDNISGALDLGEKLLSLFNETNGLPYHYEINAKTLGNKALHKLAVTFNPSQMLSDLDPRILGQFSGGPNLLDNKPEGQMMGGQLQFGQNAIFPSVFLGKWEIVLNSKKEDHNITFPLNLTTGSPFKNAILHDILAHRGLEPEIRIVSALKRYSIIKIFIEEMKEVFPKITNIDFMPYPDGTQGHVYIETEERGWLPLYVFGDGMRRWFYLIGNMLVHNNTCHCIEEIDSTFHPSAHDQLSRLLQKYATKYENQLFMTSHSIEFADLFLNALYGENGQLSNQDHDPVRVYTIRQSSKSNMPEIWRLTGKEAFHNRQFYNLEIRS